MTQLNIDFDTARFNGPDYNPARDNARLCGQMLRVCELMKDGEWRTLREIAKATGDPESSVSAQLRHLRKERFGSHTIEKHHLGDGVFVYRMLNRSVE